MLTEIIGKTVAPLGVAEFRLHYIVYIFYCFYTCLFQEYNYTHFILVVCTALVTKVLGKKYQAASCPPESQGLMQVRFLSEGPPYWLGSTRNFQCKNHSIDSSMDSILYDSGGHYREGQPHPDNFWKPLIVSWISV
jgi:hypothetical protein